MKKCLWTNEELIQSVKTSKSIAQVIKKLGLIPAGGNYSQVKARIQLLQLSTDHFSGRGWRKGKVGGGIARRSLEEILQKKHIISIL